MLCEYTNAKRSFALTHELECRYRNNSKTVNTNVKRSCVLVHVLECRYRNDSNAPGIAHFQNIQSRQNQSLVKMIPACYNPYVVAFASESNGQRAVWGRTISAKSARTRVRSQTQLMCYVTVLVCVCVCVFFLFLADFIDSY